MRGIVSKLHCRTGYFLQQSLIYNLTKQAIGSITAPIDLVWIDSGELFGPQTVKLLRSQFSTKILLLNVDDPTGRRDGLRFASLRRSLRYYDIAVTVRHETEKELCSYGVPTVRRVFRSYDEVAHQPFINSEAIPNQFRSDVAFIGTWMRNESRDRFMVELQQSGIDVAIWGARWEKSPLHKELASSIRGCALSGRDYVAAIQGAKISLGLLSKGNRDLHTQRSAEIPYAGGLLCAERTTEHLEMYRENVDAVFWKDAKECSKICKTLLADDELREKIRLSGMKRVRELQIGNEDICKQLISDITNNSMSHN